MTTGGNFWRNRLLWIGFAIAGFIDLVNGAHFLFPTIPELPVRQRDISYLFTEKPFNAIGWLPIAFYPFAIGLCFFIPLDLTFSVWFFYLFRKIQRIIGGATGWHKIAGFPYYDEQMFGAALVIFFFAIWGGKEHVKNVFKTVLPSGRLLILHWTILALAHIMRTNIIQKYDLEQKCPFNTSTMSAII